MERKKQSVKEVIIKKKLPYDTRVMVNRAMKDKMIRKDYINKLKELYK